MQEGKPERIWQYEQKMTALEDEETARLEALRTQRESLEKEQEVIDQAVMEKVDDKNAPLQQEVII